MILYIIKQIYIQSHTIIQYYFTKYFKICIGLKLDIWYNFNNYTIGDCDKMDNILNKVIVQLTSLVEHTDENNEEDVKRTTNYLYALSSHINAINREKNFVLTDEQKSKLRRSRVVWVDFGFNIGNEFGGKHPALILKVQSNYNSLKVLPIDGETTDEAMLKNRYSKGYWFKLPSIKGMKKMERWVNVLRIVDISTIRVDFETSNTNAFVDYETLDEIDEIIYKYQYRTRSESFDEINKKVTESPLI